MYKTKLFGSRAIWRPEEINEWLEKNSTIDVVSANTIANHDGWGYIILYKESDVGNDADEVD